MVLKFYQAGSILTSGVLYPKRDHGPILEDRHPDGEGTTDRTDATDKLRL